LYAILQWNTHYEELTRLGSGKSSENVDDLENVPENNHNAK